MRVINLFGGTQEEKAEVAEYLQDTLRTKYGNIGFQVAIARTLEIDERLVQGNLLAVLYNRYKAYTKKTQVLIVETPLIESLVDYCPYLLPSVQELLVDIHTRLFFDSYNYFLEYHDEHTDGEYVIPPLSKADKTLEEFLLEWKIQYLSIDPKYEKDSLVDFFVEELGWETNNPQIPTSEEWL